MFHLNLPREENKTHAHAHRHKRKRIFKSVQRFEFGWVGLDWLAIEDIDLNAYKKKDNGARQEINRK